MKNITFEQKILNVIGKKNYDKEVSNFVDELNEKLKLDLEDFGLPDDRLEYGFQDIGLQLMFDKSGRLVTVYIHFLEKDGYESFNKNYNEKINQDTKKGDIVNYFGKPSRENNEIEFSFGILTPRWVAYDYEKYTVRYGFYGDTDRLAQVTIMVPEVAPGRKKPIK